MTTEQLAEYLAVANDALQRGNYQETENAAHSILSYINASQLPHKNRYSATSDETAHENLRGDANRILGLVAFRRAEYSRAIEYFTTAFSSYERSGNQAGCAGVLGNTGSAHQRLSEYTIALEFMTKAYSLYHEIDDKKESLKVIGNIGVVYYLQSDYSGALEYFEHSLILAEELEMKHAAAIAMGNIGNIFNELSDYPKALEYYTKALALQEALGMKDVAVNTMGNIGLVYGAIENNTIALAYFFKVLTLCNELGMKDGVARHTLNVANTYLAMEDAPKALEYMMKALDLNQELGLKIGIASCYLAIGGLYFNLSEYQTSIDFFLKSLDMNEQLGHKAGVAKCLKKIGAMYADKNFSDYDYPKAQELLLQAISIDEEIGTKTNLYSCHQTLAGLFEQENETDKAFDHFKKFYVLEKEVQSEEATKQAQTMEHRRKVEEAERDRQVKLARFQEREKILDNILPSQITERLIKGEQPIADKAENVSVFFSDIVGFTSLSQKMSAKELVSGLNELFIQYDILAKKHGLEKIKTIGDAYMAVCGVPVFMENHAHRMAQFAVEIQELFHNGITIAGHKVNVRIGLHCGEVVAGVIGEQKFAYDLWGDAVNTASRMESHGETGKIHVSEEFKNAVGTGRDLSLQDVHFIERGEMDIKGKGMMKTFFLEKTQ